MKIILNGKGEELKEGVTVSDLLVSKEIRVEMVSVEVNDAILHRDAFSRTPLKEGDRVEFIYYMGGGQR